MMTKLGNQGRYGGCRLISAISRISPYLPANVSLLTSNFSSFSPFICGIPYQDSALPFVSWHSSRQPLWRELSCSSSFSSCFTSFLIDIIDDIIKNRGRGCVSLIFVHS